MSSDEKRPLGKILLQRKLVSQQELDAALRAQKRSVAPAPLLSQLVENGTVSEIEALRALSEQHGMPGIDLTQVVIVLDHLDVLPRELAEANRILPVLVRGDRIFLAVADPHEKRVVDELEFVTGKKVFPYVAVHVTLSKAIAAAYDAKARGEAHYVAPHVPAETLRQLGIAAPEPPTVTRSATQPPGRGATLAKEAPPGAPDGAASGVARAASQLPAMEEPGGGPAVVVERAVESASRVAEVSTSDFGEIEHDISNIRNLPDDLRRQASAAAGVASVGTGKLVLVVDDDEEIRRLLQRLLVQKGLRVIDADRGLLALRLVKDHVPDLIILDAMLPEIHGFDIARRIKGSAKYGAIPIVMMSAVYKGWRIAEDLKANYGVEAFLEKPFRVTEVLDVVQKLLAKNEGPATPGRDPEHLSAEAESALAQGIAAYKAGQIDPAIEHLKRGVAIDPLAYRLHFHLALLHGKKGNVYEGIQELERAIDLNPRHFPALKNLAVLYEKAGFKNKAVEMWERCAAVAPDEATRTSVRDHLRGLI
jgi:DNA-binding response OmpR family regulator